MIRVAIVEDENIYREQLEQYLKQYQEETEVEFKINHFHDGDDIVHGYCGNYDIILMDIQMQFMNGMSAAEKIRDMDQNVIIIFITNMTQYAIRGYAVDALDYMIKPVEYFAFAQKLNRAIQRLEQKEADYIYIPVEEGMVKLNVKEIFYVESQGHTLRYNTKRGLFYVRGNMQKQEDTLSPYGFFRSHKSYLVNLQYIDEVCDSYCVLHGEKISVSRKKRKNLMEKMIDYMNWRIK